MRWVQAIAVALLVNVGLFWLMQALIASPAVKVAAKRVLSLALVEVPIAPEAEVAPAKNSPSEVVETELAAATQLPPVPALGALKVKAVATAAIPRVSAAEGTNAQPSALPQSFRSNVRMSTLKFSLAQGSGLGVSQIPQPHLHINPQYPARAQSQDIEGFVTLKFEIQADGSPANIIIVDEEPRGFFGRSAKRAVRRWRYSLSAVGRIVSKRIDFKLDN